MHTHPHNPPAGRNPSCAAVSQWRPGIHIPFRLVLGCIHSTHRNKHKPINTCMCTCTHRHALYLNERRRWYYEGDSQMKPTHQGLTCGSGAAAARWGAPLPALIRGLHRRGCSRWRRWKYQLIKRHCRLSSAAIWKESFFSFIFFSLTVCLSVSFVFFVLCRDSGAGGLELWAWGICA